MVTLYMYTVVHSNIATLCALTTAGVMFTVKSNTFLHYLLMGGDCSHWYYMEKEIY